ncbi:MAG: hypothetical protein IPH12_00315 [Saprospirales bacterium]|jgi:hypothetical protein|nr:hypothetical protein [Saprospirales bacterium]MBK8923932.1 hypothetical protein [Saprospirales bacterium]
MTAYAHTDVLLLPMEQGNLFEHLHASVEFGVLQSNGNCVNIGICRINTTHFTDMTSARQKKRGCPFAEVVLSITAHGRLQAFFPRSGMKPCTERVFFRGPVFPVPVAYYLPDTVRQSLPGLSEPIIAAGLYPVRRNDEGYWIEF